MRACKCVCEHVSLYSEPRHHSDNYDQRSIMESHPTLPSTLSSSITEAPPTTTGRARVSSAEDTPKNSQAATNGIPRKKKSFINPFDPSKVHMEDSSHQHRWMHAFPRDSLGQAFQTHHVSKLEIVDENLCLSFSSSSSLSSGSSSSLSSHSPSPLNQKRQPYSESTPGHESLQQRRRRKSSHKGPGSRKTSVAGSKLVESFATVRRKGMDLSSLLEPASLPLTTDYFPDDSILNNNYVQYPGRVTVNNYGNESTMDTKPR